MIKVFYTKKGIKVTVKAELITEKTVGFGGHMVKVKCCEVFKDVEVEGWGSQGAWIRYCSHVVDGIEYPATIGDLRLTAANLKIIQNVFKSVDT